MLHFLDADDIREFCIRDILSINVLSLNPNAAGRIAIARYSDSRTSVCRSERHDHAYSKAERLVLGMKESLKCPLPHRSDDRSWPTAARCWRPGPTFSAALAITHQPAFSRSAGFIYAER
jgi:hypothetical protein